MHYFYWRWDAYKPYDYEPVLVFEKKSKIVISRFHWKLATIWFSPILKDDKPNVAFIKAVHTPIIQSKNYNHFIAMDSDDMSAIEMIDINKNATIFKKLIQNPDQMFFNEVKYDDIISNDSVEGKYILDLEKFKGIFVIGPFDPQDLPTEIQKIINFNNSAS